MGCQLDELLTEQKKKGKPVSLEFESTSGATPLVIASLKNSIKLVKVLLKHGADVNKQSQDIQETGVHIAARYGYADLLEVLLEAGANPMLLDCHGNSPMQLALGETLRAGQKQKQKLVALLKPYIESYAHHLRSRTAKSGSSSGSSSSHAPGSAAAASGNQCDYCGRVPEGRKVQKCSQCELRAYCSKECQKADWKSHKFPCNQVADIKGRVAKVLDGNERPTERMCRARVLGENETLHKFALDLKVIQQLLAAVEGDVPIMRGWLPSLVAVGGLLKDTEPAPRQPAPGVTAHAYHLVAVEQFIAAGGPLTVLKALARSDMCDEQRIDSIRGLSGIMQLKQAARPLVHKGSAAQLVQLLAPFANDSNHKLMTNASFCLAMLLRTEQHLLRQQQQQDGGQQQQQREVPPAAAAVLEHVDLLKMANPQGLPVTRAGNFYQSCMELFPALLSSRSAYKALKQEQPRLLPVLLHNAINGMALSATTAWAAALDSLHQCHRHGGMDFIVNDLRPALMQYEDEFDEKRLPQGGDNDTFEMEQLEPDKAMQCRAQFVNCLLSAAQHTTQQVQIDSSVVKVWRAASLLLRACWDGIPELRGWYQEFVDAVQELDQRYKRLSPKDHSVIADVMKRIMARYQCQVTLQQPFTPQAEYLVAVKKDPAAAALLGQILAKSAGRMGRGQADRMAGQNSSSSTAAASSSSNSEAVAGVQLPVSAAAAAALSVCELKGMTQALKIAGWDKAVEKSDVVQLLVQELGLQ